MSRSKAHSNPHPATKLIHGLIILGTPKIAGDLVSFYAVAMFRYDDQAHVTNSGRYLGHIGLHLNAYIQGYSAFGISPVESIERLFAWYLAIFQMCPVCILPVSKTRKQQKYYAKP